MAQYETPTLNNQFGKEHLWLNEGIMPAFLVLTNITNGKPDYNAIVEVPYGTGRVAPYATQEITGKGM